MTLDEAMGELRALGSEKMREHNAKHGAGDNQFGVKMGDLRALAKKIKIDHDLGIALWGTGNVDAMLLATLVVRPKLISEDALESMVAGAVYTQIADWLNTNVVKAHPQKEALRRKWMDSGTGMTARSAWSLTTERVIKNPEGLDIGGLLNRIEHEMPAAPEPVQWTMNYCLAEIGINFPEHRDRAIAIGETIGAFRDYPTPKGCTSPYAPIWIREMIKRQG